MEKSKMLAVLFLVLSIFWANGHHDLFPSARLGSQLQGTAPTLPLSASGRWIIDGQGRRVKLSCVNWASHLDVVVAEGLSKQPVDVVSKKIVSMGFNCVRLTWPLFLATNDSLAALTVRQSFQRLGLNDSLSGFQDHNPFLIDLPLISAFQAVVSSLGANNVMVILDNHISKPGWCCSNTDGNGFFGDQYFNPDLWIKGLSKMATLFKGTPNVVGMSLRNELRGPRQNITDWYRYMQQGAEAVHKNNPDVLVILSGLNYDKDLSFLRQRPVSLTFTGKTVFEAHRYAFTDGQAWQDGNANQVCGRVVNDVMTGSGFLLGQGSPLFFSEFGIDLRGTNINDNRFFSCFLGVAADLDLDWALWTLAGSYYLRQGVVGMIEYYGVLDGDWSQSRNQSFLDRISLILSPLQGPGLEEEPDAHKIIFHPSTGLCILRHSLLQPFKLGPCSDSEAWNYNHPQGTLKIKGTLFCLEAAGSEKPAKVGIICTSASSKWSAISDSKMHLATELKNGSSTMMMCLDVNSKNEVITSACRCLSNDSTCDPTNQWFKIVNSSTRSYGTSKSALLMRSALGFNSKSLLARAADIN
ncbi:hypothetical protein Dimus_015187 [Dionaea muscipula]